MALIEFKNVNKYYGDYHALRDINLEIEKGQVVVLLGPSGSGKSTLIRTINALESIDNGTLIVVKVLENHTYFLTQFYQIFGRSQSMPWNPSITVRLSLTDIM